MDARKLETALLELRKPIVGMPLLLDCPGVDAARAERRKLLSQIDDYLLPRLRQAGAPILVALVGSTGAGKSTLMNSLAGQQVSATGIRRPTTNSPVLASNPADAGWFAENVFLPTMPRVRQQGLVMPGRDGLLVLAASKKLPVGVALLDTPDIDSVVQAHHQFASQFLDASDLWLFITTARRYADAAVWELLKDARDRGASLVVVLSRVPPASVNQLTAHFDAMLMANGLADVPRFVITETTVVDSMLPAVESDPVRHWIEELARHDERQIAILTKTMSGVLDTFRIRIPNLAAHAERQLEAASQLRSAATDAYEAAVAELDAATVTGTMLRGEVLARWQDFAGNGDLLRSVEIRDGRKKAARSNQRPVPALSAALRAAISASLTALVIAIADRAAEQVVRGWQEVPAGAALLATAETATFAASDAAMTPADAAVARWEAGHAQPADQAQPAELPQPALAAHPGAPAAPESVAQPEAPQQPSGHEPGEPDPLSRSSAELVSNAAEAVTSWHEYLTQMVRTEDRTKRSIARVARFDPAALALLLSVSILASDRYDSIGGESGGGPDQVLTSLFGAASTRDLSNRARQFLHDQVAGVYRAESQRLTELIDAVAMPEDAIATQLFQAAFALESSR